MTITNYLDMSKEDLIKEIKVLSALKAALEEEKTKSKSIEKERDKVENELRLILSLIKAIDDSTDLDQATQILLEKVCSQTGWDLGQVWMVADDDSESHLVCGKSFYCSNLSIKPFRAYCETLKLEKFVGLPGRVWNIKCALWEKDITLDQSGSPRKDMAKKYGIKSQLCVPVIANGKVIMVLEFLMTKHKDEDTHFVGVVVGLSHELPGFIWKKKAEGINQILSSIVENTSDAVVSLSLEGKIKTWNLAAQEMYGYLSSEVIGKPYKILIPEDRIYETKIIVDKIMNGEEIKRYNTIRVKKDSTKMFVSINASPIKDLSGRVIGISKISHEITEDRFSRQR